ncbi:MAG: GNAT family N-acetyltransferase [Actinomycetota bacterium]
MSDVGGGPPVLVATERLVVRRFHAGDVEAIEAYRNDPATARNAPWSVPWAHDDAVMLVAEMALRDPLFERGEWAHLALERSDRVGLIGDIAVLWQADDNVAEVAFTLDPSARRRGYMTEALAAVCGRIAVDMELRLIAAVTRLADGRGRSVLERVGFRPVATEGDDVVYAWKPEWVSA